MDDANALNTEINHLDFLYNRISMPRVCIAAWLRVPEFVERIRSLDSEGVVITDAVFLKVAEPILNEKLLNKKLNRDLRLPTLKRGLNHLSKDNLE